MQYGERLKLYWNSSIAWAIDYGDFGYAMALSPDSSHLIAGSYMSGIVHIGKINSDNGAVIASASTGIGDNYLYIHTRDTRALCIHNGGWF